MKQKLPQCVSTVPTKGNITFDVFHQLHEAGKRVDNTGEITVVTTFPPPSPHDIYALGYCISTSNAYWRLGFTLHSLTPEHVTESIKQFNKTGKIITFNFGLNHLGNEGEEALLALPESVLAATQIINIRGNGLCNGIVLSSLPRNIKFLLIHENQFNPGQQMSIIDTVCSHSKLREVSFSQLSPIEVEKLLLQSLIQIIQIYQLPSDSVSAAMNSL